MTASPMGVVVPVFERPTAVLEALASIGAQTRPPAALCVVDDGSADATPDRVEAWLAGARLRFPATLLREPRRGVSAARNRGFAAVSDRVELVAFLDSDDLWPPGYLDAHARALEEAPGAIASTCDKDSIDVPSGRVGRVSRAWVAGDATGAIARRGPPGISNTVIRVEDFAAIGGFDEQLETAEDLDLMLRLSLRGRWVYVAETAATYRHRLGDARSEAPALGHHHFDRRRTRARVLDAFRERVAASRPELATVLRGLAARQWARAGRQLAGQRRYRDAIDCFDRSLEIAPMQTRARWARLRARRAQRRP